MRAPLAASILAAAASGHALAQTWLPAPFSEATIHSFNINSDGGVPGYVTLLADSTGALYGTTHNGGPGAQGTVFKLTPPAPGKSQWTQTTAYSFAGGSDGGNPYSGLTRDYSGALYGVTTTGGANNDGVAYKLTPPAPPSTQWSYAKIYDFNQSTGAWPNGAPIFDGAGALIGTTYGSGASGFGAIYRLTPPTSSGGQWTGATLYTFAGGADGGSPASTLVVDTSGAIYGTTLAGGAGGKGVAFKLTPSGTNCAPVSPNLWCETVLHAFGGSDGASPYAGLILNGASGALYGTTSSGGAHNLGVVYSLTPPVPPSTQWLETVLYSFAGGQDGANPYAPLTLLGGSLYGATTAGGGTGCAGGLGCGALFQLSPPAAPTFHWTENILYGFTGNSPDGSFPQGGLIFNALPYGFGLAVYGVSASGGTSGVGTVFSLQCAKPAREVFGGAQHAACGP
ncbi:choice-of-anchor tandem repeat GloVer-containing protein [Methylocystis heyeri]|uniref:Uncharacterized protein n=1 Tax=Methylocystis heyeri TaxID=391905 RepID=A0A6B8KD22_9HYPH|nr:choice-of-anchor tandem repeat GloVer-containing protein [Methylocystis heyeri]QGM44921.1 hypothetical protein H2LOC_004030 [Methylocystis heyeri]